MSLQIDFAVLASFALLWVVVVPTPGANTLMVAHIALSQGRRHMLAAVAGNMVGVALLGTAALLGLSILLEALPWMRRAVTIAGGLYLVYFGIMLFLGRGASPPSPQQPAAADDEPLSRSFRIGVLTSLSNAQAIVFISSIFAVAGILHSTLITGAACVAVMIAMNASYLLFIGSLLLLPSPRRLYLRFLVPVRRVFGAVFAGLGLRLVLRDLVLIGR